MPQLPITVPVTEAKGRLSELIRAAATADVLLVRHGRPAAVLMTPERLQDLLDHLDDLEDRLAVYETAGEDTVPLEQLEAQLDAEVHATAGQRW